MKLSELQTGEIGVIAKVVGQGSFRKRIIELGFVKGKTVKVIRNAPFKDPIEYEILGSEIALHRHDAELIEVVGEHDSFLRAEENDPIREHRRLTLEEMRELASRKDKTISIAFVGNPNCGKTSIYNALSGAKEHVGNYSGVTVDAKECSIEYGGYTFRLIDLPGTYSLSAYTPEERYVRKYLFERHPDVVLNVMDASNLERNLYLTTQLIDMNLRVIGALNMFDDLEKSGNKLNYVQLSKLLGIPMIPTVGKDNLGLEHLLHLAIIVYERGDYADGNNDLNPAILRELKDWHTGKIDDHSCRAKTGCTPEKCATCPERPRMSLNQIYHHVHVNHGNTIERGIKDLQQVIGRNDRVRSTFSTRYLAIKLLDGDAEIMAQVSGNPGGNGVIDLRNRIAGRIEKATGQDCESAITDAKYAFVNGALKETFQESARTRNESTRKIDDLVTHRIWGYPIFLLFMFVMFEATFVIGAYPQAWIETLVGWCSAALLENMSDCVLRDLLVDGVLGGVGSVLSFVPNILILYLFISFMEDSGYMARAAFIMDKLMHKLGLHGRSFIPMLMGFGCTVPAVMATRTIEDKRNRFITILITPFMSCTARLPIYILLTGAFFAQYAGLVLFCIYVFGILMAGLVGRLLSKTVFKSDGIPFVIELPPYRMPSVKLMWQHTWDKVFGYLKKLGGLILVASIAIWALGYFPHDTTAKTEVEQQEQSYIGRIGKFVEPVMEPLGFNWQLSVGLVSGIGAKELVVSTLGVLYPENTESEEADLARRIPISAATALAYMVFILLYVPCLSAVVAIAKETNWKWAIAQALSATGIAWICAFVVATVGNLLA
ncbi:MAG: ferrous iron transport protein B [Alistipes senegalensis]|nr:ferrous iron transport protein B [Bacteroides cellulosilyticus]MCM1352893.1 ferrous iron transport protein B [Alistipes senegalensis]